MKMSAGNAAIRDRSPDLYLFTQQERATYRFEGRFEYVDHLWESTTDGGPERLAIVFRLRRVADVVELAVRT